METMLLLNSMFLTDLAYDKLQAGPTIIKLYQAGPTIIKLYQAFNKEGLIICGNIQNS